MYNRSDPRFRRTLNTISQNLESANETAQVGLFSITEHCLKPCFYSVGDCLTATTSTCFPSSREDRRTRRLPRRRTHARGRPELSFDFYDDWEEDENDALLAWGNEEYDALHGEEAGEGQVEPSRRRIMNYGSQGGTSNTKARAPRRTIGQPNPTVIPNQSYFGFLDRLPFKIGGKGLRYKPSSAGLQDRSSKSEDGVGSTSEEDELVGTRPKRKHGRKRSATVGSGHTVDSYSSRGDIFPSDEEIDDAVPIGDDYADELLPQLDDASGGDTRKARRKSQGTRSSKSKKSSNASSRRPSKGDFDTLQHLGEVKAKAHAVDAPDADEINVPQTTRIEARTDEHDAG